MHRSSGDTPPDDRCHRLNATHHHSFIVRYRCTVKLLSRAGEALANDGEAKQLSLDHYEARGAKGCLGRGLQTTTEAINHF
jgi:hypothetical protein